MGMIVEKEETEEKVPRAKRVCAVKEGKEMIAENFGDEDFGDAIAGKDVMAESLAKKGKNVIAEHFGEKDKGARAKDVGEKGKEVIVESLGEKEKEMTAEHFGEKEVVAGKDVKAEMGDKKGIEVDAKNFGEKGKGEMAENFGEKGKEEGTSRVRSLQSLWLYGYMGPMVRVAYWLEENKNEEAKKDNVMTITRDEMKSIVEGVYKQAEERLSEMWAKEMKDRTYEYENQLAEQRKKYEMKMKEMDEVNGHLKYLIGEKNEELERRKRAQGGAARILQLEGKVKRLEDENMALECALGELLETMSNDDETDGDEEEFEAEEEEDQEDEGEENEDDGRMKDKDAKKKYSWDASKERKERVKFWMEAFKRGENDDDVED